MESLLFLKKNIDNSLTLLSKLATTFYLILFSIFLGRDTLLKLLQRRNSISTKNFAFL